MSAAATGEHLLKIAIVGCGKIADSHASQILRIQDVEIVGVCDREPLMAKQLYERFPVKGYFSRVEDLLDGARPDVVHLTTPPTSHFDLAKRCLDAGCHVYVEKPFALSLEETLTLIRLAEQKKLKITAGHDDQFRHAARRMRELVRSGYLGGNPVHMESYYCYELSRSGYAGALLSNKEHWVRQLPGKLLHNIISHGIARIAEFFKTDDPMVVTHGFRSPLLQELGETEIIDELRVIVSEAPHTTAYFTFSSQMRPSLHQFRLYGTKNGLILDQDQETLVRLRGERRTSYLEQFVTPVALAMQYGQNALHNVRRFWARDFHTKAGMKHLIESFYGSIRDGLPIPIPYRELLLTARIMDNIFCQLNQAAKAERYTGSSIL